MIKQVSKFLIDTNLESDDFDKDETKSLKSTLDVDRILIPDDKEISHRILNVTENGSLIVQG